MDIIRDRLHMDKPVILRSDLRRDNLILLKKDVTCQKKLLEERLEFRIKKLCKLIDKYHKDGLVLIFAQTTTYVDALYNILEEISPGDVTRYHSRIEPERHKKELLFDFLHGERKIMIATSAFSMGIDVPDIELVVHFNAPISMTDYIQQIGRARRDGRKAHCVLFYDQNGDDDAVSDRFIKKAKKQLQAAKTIKSNLNQVHNFIHNDNCMVSDILEYQRQHEVKTCKRCTVCAQKRRNSR
ncbi:helicase-related protein [Agathobaculum sp.]|mgnify:CR=1 FL=1|uniref:helicase-related protein n=1 Tax=Agathobaculum sp. TaxID=2048138 RepID=UPI003AB39D73